MRGIFAIPEVFSLTNFIVCLGLALVSSLIMEVFKIFKKND